MGREMWNCAKLGVLGASANKYADWAGVLINGSHSGWIVKLHCADNRYFAREHGKVRDDRSRARGDLPNVAERRSARCGISPNRNEIERFAPSAVREVTLWQKRHLN
jgi:hypothetical protein